MWETHGKLKKSYYKSYFFSLFFLISIIGEHSYAAELEEVLNIETDIETIVVTSSKRATKLSNMDGFIELISAEELSRSNINSIEQLGDIVPGLTFHQRSSSLYNNITLRGQSSPDFYATKVQVYVDGFSQDQATFGQLLPSELEYVEVLYGPQGTLYGRGAIGGVLNIVTTKPSNETTIKVLGTYGNLQKNVSMTFGGALTDNGLNADISVGYQDTKGEYKTLSNGERLGDSQHEYGQFRLRYAPENGSLDILLTARHMDVDSDEEQYVPVSQLEERTAIPVENNYALISDNYTATLSYDFDKVILTSLSGYQDRHFDRTVFGSYSPEEQTTFNQEFRVASVNKLKDLFSYVFGTYYETVDFKYQRPAFALTSIQKTHSYAVFGDLTWQVTNKFDITSGVRVDWHKVDAQGIFGIFEQSSDDKYTSTSPKISIGYQISPSTRFYTLYSTGFKAGGFTKLVTPVSVAFGYSPEKVDNIETGIRSSFWQNKLDLSLAAYYTKNDDYQFFVGEQPFQYLQNIGDAETKGLDFSLKVYPTDQLTSFFSVTYNDAQFTKYANPYTPELNFKGNYLPYAPKVTAHLHLSYEILMGNSYGSLTPSFEMNYKGKTYFDEANSINQEGFVLLNANIQWVLSDDLSVDAHINNIADKDYTVYGFDGGVGLGELYQLGKGREFSLRLHMSF